MNAVYIAAPEGVGERGLEMARILVECKNVLQVGISLVNLSCGLREITEF